ncbi:MAG: RNA polymerase sigma factor [Bacteroidales bacterium]|jgi:RNA polymerase sigma-70 factor (ECF subfamily)|nr:RNA polymerase sigma factor [Bacteroidales bacterium]MBP8709705.1 RNA polymerase sigma factor [Bacteroidales bacterium]
MYQICISYSGDRVEAKDILQDAFVKVFTSLEKFDAKGSLEGWVRRIVTNTAIDHLRKKRRVVFTDGFTEEPEDEERSSSFFRELSTDTILRFIRQLPDGARIVFNLFAVDDLSHKEIAEKLQISVGTSKSQYNRARNLLKKWLCEYEQSNQ